MHEAADDAVLTIEFGSVAVVCGECKRRADQLAAERPSHVGAAIADYMDNHWPGRGIDLTSDQETRKATITACTATIAATPAYTMRSAGFATSGSSTMKATVIVASGTTNIAVVKRRKRWNDATLAGSLRWRCAEFSLRCAIRQATLAPKICAAPTAHRHPAQPAMRAGALSRAAPSTKADHLLAHALATRTRQNQPSPMPQISEGLEGGHLWLREPKGLAELTQLLHEVWTG